MLVADLAGGFAVAPDFPEADLVWAFDRVAFDGADFVARSAGVGMSGIIVESPIAFVINRRSALSLMTRARITGSASRRM